MRTALTTNDQNNAMRGFVKIGPLRRRALPTTADSGVKLALEKIDSARKLALMVSRHLWVRFAKTPSLHLQTSVNRQPLGFVAQHGRTAEILFRKTRLFFAFRKRKFRNHSAAV